jgi:hypothetical protein
MIRYAYNQQVEPPAPFVLVTLRNPVTGLERENIAAQLDYAADRTLLPSDVAQSLVLPAIGSVFIGGVGGTVAEMTVYAVAIAVHQLPPRPVEVVAHPNEPWILLGRDVLNSHRVVLDGPQLALEIG